jgi:hypothetical protein
MHTPLMSFPFTRELVASDRSSYSPPADRSFAEKALPIVLLAATVAACGDGIGPTREVTLSFCPIVAWAGIQNAGEGWRSIATGPGAVTIDASQRLTIAVISGGFDDQALEFYYLTRDQARATFVCPATGAKQLSGAVAGVSDGFARISMGSSAASASLLRETFTLEHVADGPLDLVATYLNTAIVRRDANYADGATIPTLDFASAEAFALQAHTLTIEPNGVLGPVWGTEILTRGGTRGHLSSSGSPCCTDGRIFTLPASRQESGDLYRLTITSTSGRAVERYYDTPSDQTVAFGPPANGATLTAVATAGELWRAEIVAQPEYASQVELVVGAPQPTTNTTRTVIRASAEFFGGTPGTWRFTVPDLSRVPGFPAEWPRMPVPGGWRVHVSDAPWASSPTTARAGDTYRSAAVASSF